MRSGLLLIGAVAGASMLATSAQAQFTQSSSVARERAQELKRECGPSAPWRGLFSGGRYNNFINELTPYSDRGCFETERECRIWQNLSISVLNGGPLRVMSCRQ